MSFLFTLYFDGQMKQYLIKGVLKILQNFRENVSPL